VRVEPRFALGVFDFIAVVRGGVERREVVREKRHRVRIRARRQDLFDPDSVSIASRLPMARCAARKRRVA